MNYDDDIEKPATQPFAPSFIRDLMKDATEAEIQQAGENLGPTLNLCTTCIAGLKKRERLTRYSNSDDDSREVGTTLGDVIERCADTSTLNLNEEIEIILRGPYLVRRIGTTCGTVLASGTL